MKEFLKLSNSVNARKSRNEPYHPISGADKKNDLRQTVKDQLDKSVLKALRAEAKADSEEELDEEAASYLKP
ncbi:hypothetical protein Lqui_2525 [Legionella quinlivanii]|uniref:Uncharacterized protein n=1 Tax=Legionella quinlivanii TaxID=45073 RepID=A0A0W0XPV3_9GAMM|nr:hypothetical protein [Legionella quinlivanii]KTD46600.1 hypothetical protein Lqui_2525 [Legionella quinlivanii]MCW8451508.1 hypothetical protein [Legionella quinlivanii]SEG08296.1 hypothetical protein SAMN02746093_01803 [Legionella quinlivanii DSM 21216]STY10289.1 Uncharacterised protein [Legionella quinlivanii]